MLKGEAAVQIRFTCVLQLGGRRWCRRRLAGRKKEREEARLLGVGGLALMHLCREGSAARARVVRATQASEI